MGNSENVSNFRRRRKSNLMMVAGNKCCLCNYDKIPDALEFHHINPEEKEYSISHSGNCHDLEKDLLEIQKCILVCANCHREIHKGLYTKEDLLNKQIFNEDIANQLRQEKQQLFEKTEYFCSSCNKKLFEKTKTGLCTECYNIVKRKAERPSREELKQLIRTTPFTQIALNYGVSDNAIRKWCDAENLPRKKADINQYSDEEWAKI